MSASTTEFDETEFDDEVLHDYEGHHGHPTSRGYVKIALILAVLTAAEVATYPLEDTLHRWTIAILLPLMVVKFYYVAAFFMHLKFDSRMFSWVFVAGIVTATLCYLVAVTTLEIWSGA